MPDVEVELMPEVMPELVDNNLLVLLREHYFDESVQQAAVRGIAGKAPTLRLLTYC